MGFFSRSPKRNGHFNYLDSLRLDNWHTMCPQFCLPTSNWPHYLRQSPSFDLSIMVHRDSNSLLWKNRNKTKNFFHPKWINCLTSEQKLQLPALLPILTGEIQRWFLFSLIERNRTCVFYCFPLAVFYKRKPLVWSVKYFQMFPFCFRFDDEKC